MTSSQRRIDRLRALREQELARAVDQLNRAEEDASGVEVELERTRRRLDEIAGEMEPPAQGAVASAGALASGSRKHEVNRGSIARLEAERREIDQRLDRARADVGSAREVVATATRALRALDRPR